MLFVQAGWGGVHWIIYYFYKSFQTQRKRNVKMRLEEIFKASVGITEIRKYEHSKQRKEQVPRFL